MKLLIGLACAMLVGCGAADPDFGSPSCDKPQDAVYEPTVTTQDVGCPIVAQSVKVVGGEPRFGGGSVTTVSGDKCFTDTVLGKDWMSLEWSSNWSVGYGTAVVGACRYDVQLVKQ